jgi:hypothetical protein
VLHADSADSISDAVTLDRTERPSEHSANVTRFSGAIANRFANTDAFAIERSVSPAFGDALAGANSFTLSC